MSSDQKRVLFQVLLGIVIIVLGYILYVSITGPYEKVREQERMTERTRQRMDLTRRALIRYRKQNNRFPGTLDSLVMFVNQTPNVQSMLDSVAAGPNFAPDSLGQSPRTGKPFNYAVNDTGSVTIYRLRDPDSEDQIGTLQPDVTQINAANWE